LTAAEQATAVFLLNRWRRWYALDVGTAEQMEEEGDALEEETRNFVEHKAPPAAKPARPPFFLVGQETAPSVPLSTMLVKSSDPCPSCDGRGFFPPSVTWGRRD
jgi:hypothetical protein